VPLQPTGQRNWESTILEEEPQAPGYGTQNCGMTTNSVNDFLVCRYSPSGNYPGQFPYGQGAAAAPATNAPPPPAAVGEEQNTTGDQGAVQ
jgi:hypothetical protein